MLAACALYGAIGLWAFVRMYRKMVADRDQWRDTANNWRDELEAECNLLKVENAKLRENRFCAAAWVLDRADQYENDSPTRAAFDEIMQGLANGEHLKAAAHGELDDLLIRPFIQQARDLLAKTEVDDG